MKKQRIKIILWDFTKLILPAFVGFLFAYITFSKQYDASERSRFNENLNKILDVNLEYPYIDDNDFINRWSKTPNSHSDSSIRYQTYCIFVFNFLQDISEYYKYNKERVEQYVDIEDLILQHKV